MTVIVQPPRGFYAQHAIFTDEGLALTICLSEVPAHSPYQAGDWVRCHGLPGMPNGPQRWGWRGFVLGSYGGTVLRGIRDDGGEWAENWGALVRDDGGRVEAYDNRCSCCRRVAPPRPRPEQLSLFDALGIFGCAS